MSGNIYNSGVLINSATDSSPSFSNGSGLTNLAGGTVDLQGNGGFNMSSGVINNAGLFKKSLGSGTSTINSMLFNNTGTVEVDCGVLKVGFATSSNGTFVFSNNGRFQAGGDMTLSGTTIGTGNGGLEDLQGGIVAYTPATINFSASSPLILDGGGLGGLDGAAITNVGTIQWSSGGMGAVNNSGSIIVSATDSSPLISGLNNLAGGTIDIQGNGGFSGNSGNLSVLNNAGLLKKSLGSGTSTIASGIHFGNTGTVEVDIGTLQIQAPVAQVSGNVLTGGTWNVESNATLSMPGSIATNAGSVTLSGTNSNFAAINGLSANQGSFSLLNGRSFVTAGALQNSGSMTIGAGSTLAVTGSLSLLGGGNLVLQIGGVCQGTDYGTISVTGSTSLGGALELSFAGGFQSQLLPDETFTLLSGSGALSGAFSNVANGAVLETEDGLGAFTVNYGPASPYGANNVVLSQGYAAPEPETWMMVAAGVGVLAAGRKKSGVLLRKGGPWGRFHRQRHAGEARLSSAELTP